MRSISVVIAIFLAAAEATPVVVRSSQSSKLSKRNILNVACGNFPSADPYDAGKNRQNLEDDTECNTIEAGKCGRFGCYNTSGIWVCNDQSEDICVSPADAVALARFSDDVCQPSQAPYSGQTFTDNEGGYNVVEGYADCNNSPDMPGDYGEPNGGVNGWPTATCGLIGGSPCVQENTAKCVEGSIVVTEQSGEECGAYLLEEYIGGGDIYTYSNTHQTVETWTLGGSLGIDTGDLAKISGQLQFEASYSKSVITGDTLGVSSQCGDDLGHNGQTGNWTCAMEIKPACLRTKGWCDIRTNQIDNVKDELLGRAEFELVAPVSNDEGHGVWSPQLCVCRDCAGWAEGGAPQEPCDLPCQIAACKAGGA